MVASADTLAARDVGLDLQEFETEIDRASCFEELWHLYVDFVQSRGIWQVGYHHLPPLGAPDAHVQRLKNTGFSVEWVDFYLEAREKGTTPMSDHAQQNGEPVYWDEIDLLRALSPEEEAHLVILRAAGFTEGICIPTFGPNGRNGMFALRLRVGMPRLPLRSLRDVNWACQTAHLRYCALLLPSLGEPPHLSRRESEVLRWVALGKSNASIGSILGISTHTVDAHLRRIYLKMGVFDRISAALRGMGFGLIHSG